MKSIDFGNASIVADLMATGVNRRDTDRSPIKELGYQLSLWNGLDDDYAVSLQSCCGSYSQYLSTCNVITLTLPWVLGNFAIAEHAVNTLSAVVDAWDPDWAEVSSSDSKRLREYSPDSPFVDWIIYQRGLHIDLPNSPCTAKVVNTCQHGDILITQEDPVDPTNESHLRNVHSALEMLRQ